MSSDSRAQGGKSDARAGGGPGGGPVGGGPVGSEKRAPADAFSGELATLITVYDPVEVEIIVAKLRSAGIRACARHEALSTVWGLTVDGAGQNDILVRAEDLEEARAALEREA